MAGFIYGEERMRRVFNCLRRIVNVKSFRFAPEEEGVAGAAAVRRVSRRLRSGV